jgi:hypothetical protein
MNWNFKVMDVTNSLWYGKTQGDLEMQIREKKRSKIASGG